MHFRPLLIPTVFAAVVLAAPLADARNKLTLVPSAQMDRMGTEAFAKMKATQKLSQDAKLQAQAQCVVQQLVAALPEKKRQQAWEVQVFEDKSPNAFALPGGKVGINSGLFAVARNQDEMAAVVGHEIAHVLQEHSNERVSRQMLAGIGLEVLGAYTDSKTASQNSKLIMGALGLGAQVGVLLPNSRKQESEADLAGQKHMARAGFDPARAVTLWQQMIALGKKGAPPQILSTHPNPEQRIEALAERLPAVMPLYQEARQAGRVPKCY